FTQRADVLRPTSKPRSQIQSLRENPRLKLEAWARARLGVSITPTITVPERLAPDSRGPSQCSGISHINRRKPAPALASVAAASPAISGAGARTTVSEPSSGEKEVSVHGSNPPPSITIARANSRVAPASSDRPSESLPHVPFPVNSARRPRGKPPIPVRRSTAVPLGHGRGGGSSAALVSAWLPKRIRIESIASSRFCACIFQGASEQDAGEKWRQL